MEVRYFTARLKAGEADVNVALADDPGSGAADSQPAAPSGFRQFWAYNA